jgi:hypothetical protein
MAEIDVRSLDKSIGIERHAERLGVSYTTLRRRIENAGLTAAFKDARETRLRDEFEEKKRRYYDSPQRCKCCGSVLPYEKRKYQYCSSSCFGTEQFADPERRRKASEEVRRRQRNGTWKIACPPVRQRVARVQKQCLHCGKLFEVLPSEAGYRKCCSRHCAGKLSKRRGGYREGSGVGKSGWFRGVYCASTWELAWVMYHIDHGIVFRRNLEGFPYKFNGQNHVYIPDFQMSDGSYVEIKGYESPRWKAKREQFPHLLVVIDKNGIDPYVMYAVERYGKEFWSHYEGNPHNERHNHCVICGSACKKLTCSRVCSGKLVASRKISLRPIGESAISGTLQVPVSGSAPE